MNYIKELNGFQQWISINQMSSSAICLWHTLLSVNNMARWKVRFNAPNRLVEQLSGLSHSGIHKARKELTKNELIIYEPGVKGRAPVYQMVSFERRDDRSVDDPLCHVLQASKSNVKEEKITNQVVISYEENIGKLPPFLKEELDQWKRIFDEKVIIEAMKQTCKNNGKTFHYFEKILLEWQRNGVRSIKDVVRYEGKKKHSTKQRYSLNQKSALFDELRQEGD